MHQAKERRESAELEQVQLQLAVVLRSTAEHPRRRSLQHWPLAHQECEDCRVLIDRLEVARVVNVGDELLQIEQPGLAILFLRGLVASELERLAHHRDLIRHERCRQVRQLAQPRHHVRVLVGALQSRRWQSIRSWFRRCLPARGRRRSYRLRLLVEHIEIRDHCSI